LENVKAGLLVSFILIVPLVFTFSFGFIGKASGHSVPDTYSLSPNTLVQNSKEFPNNITIIFSERPDPKVSYIHVTDSAGNRIDDGIFRITGVDERQAIVLVDKNKVEDGVYSISWLTLSEDDGHISKGTYVVGVGPMSGLTQAPSNAMEHEEKLTPIMAAIKTPIIISQVCVLGFVISHFIIWRGIPVLELRSTIYDQVRIRFRKVIVFSAIAIIVAATILIMVQTFDITEKGTDYFGNLTSLIYETSSGTVWIVRIVSSVVILLAFGLYSRMTIPILKDKESRLILYRKKMTLLVIILLASVIGIATNSLVSHSASVQSATQVAITIDFLHFCVVSIWVGGLVYLSYVFFPNLTHISSALSGRVQQIVESGDSNSIILLTLSRFSTAASISLGVIGITGLYLAWIHINSVGDLFYSDYGKVLIIKLSIALPALLLGAYHQFWIRRIFNKLFPFSAARQEQDTINRSSNTITSDKVLFSIRTTIRLEAILALCILCAAAFLTVTPLPAYQDNANYNNNNNNNTPDSQMPPNTTTQKSFVQELSNQGVPSTLQISPFQVGFNNFTVSIPETHQNSSQISEVFIEFKKKDGSLGPIIAKLQRTSPGVYSIVGGYLSQPGQWDMKITVQRSSAYDLNYRLSAKVNNTNTAISEAEHMDHEANMQMNMSMPIESSSTLSESQQASANSPYFNYLFLGLGIAVGGLSFIFYIHARKSMNTIQNYLGLRK
jgi:putative copper export protein/methionine-rich copper-binding protein CopC